MNQVRTLLLLPLLCLVTVARADWTPLVKIDVLNIGGNGMHGTHVSAINFSFSGCSSPVAFIEGANPNYKEFIASLLAAKIAGKDVKLLYSGCVSGYPVIREVAIP